MTIAIHRQAQYMPNVHVSPMVLGVMDAELATIATTSTYLEGQPKTHNNCLDFKLTQRLLTCACLISSMRNGRDKISTLYG